MSEQVAGPILASAVKEPWFKHIYVGERLGDPKTSRWLKEIRHDPFATLTKLQVPALLVYGARDPWVPVAASVQRFRAARLANKNLRAVVLPDADHAMMMGVEPARQIDPASFPAQAPNSPAYFSLLAAWLGEVGLVSPPAG
jgi:fermentation-respiration switch protein FrsA (DUF1100 family)